MSAYGRLRKYVASVVSRRNAEREMQEEMAAHLEQAAERFAARGMSTREARLAARREFGNLGVVQEQARDARGARWVDSVGGDIRFAIRQIRRAPLLAATVVLTLMIGIGTNAGLASLLNGVIARPAPGVPDDAALFFIRGMQRLKPQGRQLERELSFGEVLQLRALPEFEDVAAWTDHDVVTQVGNDGASAKTASAALVTPNYFAVGGIRLATGPGFMARTLDESGVPERSVIVSHAIWTSEFGSDPEIVGRSLKVGEHAFTIVGVAPPRFNGIQRSAAKRRIWLPVSAARIIDPERSLDLSGFASAWFEVAGRLRPETTVDAAERSARAVATLAAARLKYEPVDPSTSLVAIAADRHLDFSGGDDLLVVSMFGTIGLLILLVCCTNVSSLLVGAAVSRRQEIGVRLSMGASRARVIRQLLTETAILAMTGGVLGLLVYWAVIARVGYLLRDVEVSPDWTSAFVAMAIAIAATVICGLSPALHATRHDLASVLKDSASSATRPSRLQRTLVVSQVALTQPLLMALATTVLVLGAQAAGRGKVTLADQLVRVRFHGGPASESGPASVARREELVKRIASLPGVAGVTVQPGEMMGLELRAVGAVGKAAESFDAILEPVPPGYFSVMGALPIAGREFIATEDTVGPRPLMMEAPLAAELWPGRNPVGQTLVTAPDRRGRRGEYVVIGVIPPGKLDRPHYGPSRRMYLAANPKRSSFMNQPNMVIRTTGPAEALVPTLRAIGAQIKPAMPLTYAKTFAEMERDRRRSLLQASGASAAAGLLALFLAAIGLYAVVSLGVAQRTREIGVRISVGASPAEVVRMFFRGGIRLAAIGMVSGLSLGAVVLELFASQIGLPEIRMTAVIGAVAGSVVVIAALATYLPARRASRVDPVVALRTE